MLSRALLSLRSATGEQGARDRCPTGARLSTALGPAYDDHGLVFCWANGRPIAPTDFPRLFARLLRKAGLPPVRFHDARHTFATLLLEQGESPKTVQTLLGHTTIKTTMDIYTHVSLELEKRAAARLNGALKLAGA